MHIKNYFTQDIIIAENRTLLRSNEKVQKRHLTQQTDDVAA